MVAWIDEAGFVYRSPRKTVEGIPYPVTVVPPPQSVVWTDVDNLSPTAEVTWVRTIVYSGPDAPYPPGLRRDFLFRSAIGMSPEQWQRIATLEATDGVYLETEGSIARMLWDRVYAFRPYELRP